MKLKKFMYLNIILSLFILGSIYLISQLTKYYTQNDLLRFKNYLTLDSNSVKLINLGSSHGMYGLFYSKTDFSKMNLARSAQNYYYDLELLEKYSDKLNDEVVILIPISMISFYSHFREDINVNYIPLLKSNEIMGIEFKKYCLMKNFLILYPISNSLNIVKNIKKLKNSDSNIVYPKDLKMIERKKESKNTVEQHLGISPKYYLIKNAEQDFVNLINYIEKKSWKYVLITTPFSYLYNENIEKYQKDAFKERIYDNIKEVEKKLNKKFVYLDYSHDERFENNLEYFYDDDHLNEKGAKYFTEILLGDLKRIGFNIE